MTRPQIVRADTLDLQDKSSPTAQDHSNVPSHPAPLGIGPAAPHQEASLRRVDEQRTDEEERLQNGAQDDAHGLRDEPPSDDESTVAVNGNAGDNAAVRLNGGISGEGDDADMQDADADAEEDLDDMDRISSSPSISDGGLPFRSSAWQERGSSPSRSSSPIASPPSSSSAGCDSSSPFTETPIHFPLPTAAARRPLGVPASSAKSVTRSPYQLFPRAPSFPFQNSHTVQSADHHHGEYARPRTTSDQDSANAGTGDDTTSPNTEHLTRVENRLQNMRLDSLGSLSLESDDGTVLSPLFSNLDDPFYEPNRSSYGIPKRSSSLPRTTEEEANRISQYGNPPLTLGHDEDSYDDSYEDSYEDSWTDDSDADSWDATLDDNDDDTKDLSFSFSDDSRFVDSGWGGECLREVEDIDFEFVYSLHTFVATVEGQANATKGDTMVLLDDSNSYWWLVRVVKDNSIGYLPAEHIETPTERLARLNKHRNIDLSATMLGDTAEKPKNTLKKAMRRRNTKTVAFAQPQYFEPSDYDYSSDEDDGDELFGGADPNEAQQATTENSESEPDENLKVQPLKVNGAKDTQNKSENESNNSADDSARGGAEKQRDSEESYDKPMDLKVSRNGTMRNTDSFFKDDSTETRKITLTPNLLRDDSSTSTTGSKERGPSLESLEKNGFADKVKDDKKKKEKKPGMLSGLFKRKDKDKKSKGGSLDSIDSDVEPSSKQSEEYGRESPQEAKTSEENALERTSSEQSAAPSRQSSKGKLQKPQHRREESPSKIKGILKTDTPELLAVQSAVANEPVVDKSATQTNATMRLVSPEEQEDRPAAIEERAPPPEKPSPLSTAASKLNPLNIVKSSQSGEPKEPKPEKVKKSKQRVQLDDFDTDEEDQDPFADPDMSPHAAQHNEPEPSGRLSESPVHVSAADARPPAKDSAQEKDQESDSQHPPGLTGDSSSQETSSPISTPTPDDNPTTSQPSKPTISTSRSVVSPDPTEPTSASSLLPPSQTAPTSQPQKETDISPLSSSQSTTLPAWSDHSLRTYLDDGSDIRDMLLVVNDTTGVVPVGPEHPIMAQLFVEETKTVSGLSSQLDTLLNGLLEKRLKRSLSGSSKATSPIGGR